MHLVKNTSKGPINLESGKIAPGENGDATPKEYALLMSNHRIEDYDYPEPPKAPPQAPKAASKRKPEKKAAAPDSPSDFL